MLVGCIGVPGSGKTTAAAEVFLGLKKTGFTAEFVVEVARQYIAQKKRLGGPVVLTDMDQIQIAIQQERIESLMNDPSLIVVSDSSPLNAWLYMTPEAQEQFIATKSLEFNATHYDLLVLVEGDGTVAEDAHRAHGAEHVAHLQEQCSRLVGLVEACGTKIWVHRRGQPVDALVWHLVNLFQSKMS